MLSPRRHFVSPPPPASLLDHVRRESRPLEAYRSHGPALPTKTYSLLTDRTGVPLRSLNWRLGLPVQEKGTKVLAAFPSIPRDDPQAQYGMLKASSRVSGTLRLDVASEAIRLEAKLS